ncbi:helix-turn-helix domain-containing protein [Paenibacillus sp. M1]|uniref:Helix-turn-helix domain-containing protein n=1 Tax=Paenibacillus haidiansis TaxID=1574488 RepID=A0ABU7VR98_9BACL
MNLLIVDDEVIIRTGLASVIAWKELGLTLLSPAASAEEALERIPVEKPHILLTDIRMKGKSGLELAEEARKLLPGLEVVILSGYDDFAYAQQALRQGVSDYLLKTSKPEDIIRTVMQAKRRWLERSAADSRAEQAAREAAARRLYRWVIEGDVAPPEPPPFRPAANSEAGTEAEVWQAIIVSAEGWGSAGSPESESLLLFAVQNILEDLIPGAAFIPQKGRIVCAARMSGEREERRRMLRGWLDWVERHLKCRLILAVGEPAAAPDRLHHSYVTAVAAFRYHGLMPRSVWDCGDLAHRSGGKTVLSQEEESLLGSLLLANDAVGLKAWAVRLTAGLVADPECTLESAGACLQSAALAAHRWLERTLRAIGRDAEGDGLRPEPWSPEMSGQPGLAEELFGHLHDIMSLYHRRLGDSQTSHVERAKAYMESCPPKDLGLQQVAAHLHLHPGHLSEIFKRETGVTFVDFVTGLRMRKAEQLLRVTPARIAEIAWMVGYEDVKYFGRLFKKHCGKTPSEYREEALLPRAEKEPGA